MAIKRVKREDVGRTRENRKEQQIKAEGYRLSLEAAGTLQGEMRRKGLLVL